MGFESMDNHAYLRAQEAADKPAGMMRPPPAIIAALPLRRRLEAAAREHGYRYLTHDSALGGARTFIVIPDAEGRFDQWMLFNFSDDQQPEINAETPFSFVAVQKKDAAGRARSPGSACASAWITRSTCRRREGSRSS